MDVPKQDGGLLLHKSLKTEQADQDLIQRKRNDQATSTARTVENLCPPGVIESGDERHMHVLGDSCFHFVLHKRKAYSDANRDCQGKGGTLALVKNQHINDFLVERLLSNKGEQVWIGLHDKKKEDMFVWEDGSPAIWTNFARNNGPSNGLSGLFEDCVAIDPNDHGLWHDFQCIRSPMTWASGSTPRKPYICQYRLHLPGSERTHGAQDEDAKNKDDSDESTPEEDCPQFHCDLDCGMDGFKLDENNCQSCGCNE